MICTILNWDCAETVGSGKSISIEAPKLADQIRQIWPETRAMTTRNAHAFCQSSSSSFLGGIYLFFGGQAGSRSQSEVRGPQ